MNVTKKRARGIAPVGVNKVQPFFQLAVFTLPRRRWNSSLADVTAQCREFLISSIACSFGYHAVCVINGPAEVGGIVVQIKTNYLSVFPPKRNKGSFSFGVRIP